MKLPGINLLRSNIWRGILSATDTEIHEGMSFYHGANGLCRFLSKVFKTTSSQVAGIYAALSPMNGWETNVANVIDVLWNGWNSRVNTSHLNHWKALAIYHGADPLTVLGGSKVRSFYSAISDSSNLTPIPVDRHLICLALGVKITSNQDLRSLASNSQLYSKIESAYQFLGDREGIGNRLASIAWFVQRRIFAGQIPLLQQSDLVCCGVPVHSHGSKQWRCKVCGRTLSRYKAGGPRHDPRARLARQSPGAVDGFRVTLDTRGRRRIQLGRSHPYSNSAGWQYLSRYLVMKSLNRKLRTDEHAHHKDLNKSNDDLRLTNYEVLLAQSHGQYHTYLAEIAGYRDKLGRFIEHSTPIEI